MFKLFKLFSNIFPIFNQILKSLEVRCPFLRQEGNFKLLSMEQLWAARGRRQVESVCRPCSGRDCVSLESQTEGGQEKQPKVNLSKVELLAISCCSWLFLTFTCSFCLRLASLPFPLPATWLPFGSFL